MELYLQFGHGMKSLTVELSKKWNGITTILSPRDMTPKQLTDWSDVFNKNGVHCLFDPQCYCPKSELKKLSQYDYWNAQMNTNLQSEDNYETRLIKHIKKYNDIAKTTAFIIPNILEAHNEEWSDIWVKRCKKLIEASKKVVDNKERFITLTLPQGFLLQKEDEIERLIEIIGSWDVDGYYIIAETPNKQYLVDNPLWLSNVLQLCAALKILNKKVIYGYGNHQMLCLSMAKVDAMASGTWLNVRSFTNRFIVEEGMKKKSLWYYYPQALSEYKMTFLDLAYSNNSLLSMQPDKSFENEYAEVLFSGKAMPSATGFNETVAFKHYLHSLRKQVTNCNSSSFKDTVLKNEIMINTAERVIEQMEKVGIYAQSRSFRDIVDINRAAMQRLIKNRGFLLEHSWTTI